jgi:hypothetical protein
MITSARSGLARSGNTRSGLSVSNIEGVTRDGNGAPLGGCIVHLFETSTDILRDTIISDEIGHFAFVTTPGVQYYMVAYLTGSPDVSGTTRHDLVGV